MTARPASTATTLTDARVVFAPPARLPPHLLARVTAQGACPWAIDKLGGRTALHYAAQSATGVPLLLQAGADVNVQDKDGCTPLLLAACVECVVDKKADGSRWLACN